MNQERLSDLASEGRRARGGMAGELLALLRHNKKWWLLPLLVVLVLAAVLVALGSGAIAPFIYAVF